MDQISFHLPINPPKATSQGAGKRMVIVRGKPMFFKSGKAVSVENDLTLLCQPYAPETPLEGPVWLRVTYTFPWRKAEKKSNISKGFVPHTSRPDASNLIKMIEDVMTNLRFWQDDSQIALLEVSKGWGDSVGITVSCGEIELK